MCFHFPVMPRIFMAVRRESRFPISEILEQTPAIPDGCQWGIFLRNHDELTLEMVTDEDRDYMWGEYAKDPRMKANIGIRRRLAPLLDNDINQIELFTALLLSLPGSPVLYYGDEIGMGDNIWLGDRDGVRTPMQWTPDRNAGFSSATPGQAAPAGDPGPGLRLPERQRRGAARELLLAAALDPADDPGPPPAPGVRPRRASPTSAARTRPCCPTSASTRPTTAATTSSCASTTCRASRSRSSSTCAAGRAWCPVELLGGVPFPRDRRAAVPPDAGWVRLLLVPADPTRHRRGDHPVTDSVSGHQREASAPTTPTEVLTAFIERPAGSAARAARSRSPASAASARCPSTRHGPRVAIDLVEVTYEDGGDDEYYQLPLAFYAEPQERLDHAFVGAWDDPDFGTSARRTTRCTTARRWPAGCAPSPTRRPEGSRCPSTGCPGTSSTSTRTRRSSAASSRTPRWPSARTR